MEVFLQVLRSNHLMFCLLLATCPSQLFLQHVPCGLQLYSVADPLQDGLSGHPINDKDALLSAALLWATELSIVIPGLTLE